MMRSRRWIVAQHRLKECRLLQVAPPGTVHLGLSICAMVWLSSPPAGGAKDGICHLDGVHSRMPFVAGG